MRLLRITHHIKQQNWLAVFLDFLIVVIGVFIGLQVSNWNQNRLEQQREEKLLQELVEDLNADLLEIDSVLYFTRMRYSADATMLKRAINWQIPDQYPDDFEKHADYNKPKLIEPKVASDALYFSMRVSGFDMEKRTYSKLTFGGDFTLTQDPELPELLRKHYNLAQQWMETETRFHDPLYSKLIDTYSQYGIGMLDQISWQQLDSLIANTPQLQGMLKNSIWITSVQNEYLHNIRKNTQSLIQRIQQHQAG
ncbi:DUF6090 family protein [Neptunicella marina]|uniref:Uncharacterized protein n=1 Tax=Neptunicella marina TaxID=2125989 RepID=A0A8J6IS01_9ALTE|nr:DUF6090 family protein [Neptunicella marina]MBC3764700.1 hypothetical protein [Neptunicella marina]